MNSKIIEAFNNKVWLTRKDRINASERLSAWDFWTKIHINYYSFITVVFSVWSIYPSRFENTELTFSLLISSIFLFGLSLFISSMNYKGRSESLKFCYIKLDELYIQLKILEEEITSGNLSEEHQKSAFINIQKQYSDILHNSENHSLHDHLITLKNIPEVKFTNKQNIDLFIYKAIWILSNFILVSIPLFLISMVIYL